MRRQRTALFTLVLALAIVGAACGPRVAAGPPGGNDADGWAAVDNAFTRFGPDVLACAHHIAERESHHGAGATNGQYRGIFQMGPHFQGAVDAAAATLGRPADFYDGWVNAWAASLVFEQNGWQPWAGTKDHC